MYLQVWVQQPVLVWMICVDFVFWDLALLKGGVPITRGKVLKKLLVGSRLELNINVILNMILIFYVLSTLPWFRYDFLSLLEILFCGWGSYTSWLDLDLYLRCGRSHMRPRSEDRSSPQFLSTMSPGIMIRHTPENASPPWRWIIRILETTSAPDDSENLILMSIKLSAFVCKMLMTLINSLLCWAGPSTQSSAAAGWSAAHYADRWPTSHRIVWTCQWWFP